MKRKFSEFSENIEDNLNCKKPRREISEISDLCELIKNLKMANITEISVVAGKDTIEKGYILNSVKQMEKKIDFMERNKGINISEGGSDDKQYVMMEADTAFFNTLDKIVKSFSKLNLVIK